MLEYKPLVSYSRKDGLLNIAWISGFARHFTHEGDRLIRFIQQTNDNRRLLPVRQTIHSSRTLATVAEKTPIKITGRVLGYLAIANNGTRQEHSAYLDPLQISSPSILEMPSSLIWEPSDNNGDMRINWLPDAANHVRIAGIVAAMNPLRSPGDPHISSVEIILRQTKDPDPPVLGSCRLSEME